MLKKPKLEKLLQEIEPETKNFYIDKRADALFRIGVIKSVLGQDARKYVDKIFETMPTFMTHKMHEFLLMYEIAHAEDPSLGLLSWDKEEWKPHFCKQMILKYFGFFDEDFKKAYPFIEKIYEKKEKF